ncbi:MAG: GGDEF domain-containing protein [Lachnospiraceae bacterium]|nr:GGDEF domain-containing protein [Lachnospiraceae bacterium]
MKDKGIFDRVMHFLVHNSNMVTVAVMACVHIILLLFMVVMGVTPLVQFNILSVVVYLFCVMLCRAGHFMPVFISIILEVTAYTIISTHFIGLRCGTYCFLFSIVPIIIYLGCFLFKRGQRWIVTGLLAVNFAIFAFLYIAYAPVEPQYELTDGARLLLVLFSSFVMITSTIIYSFIYIYSSEVEVNSLEQKNRQLSVDAHEDALTSLLNRRGFLPVVEKLMQDKKGGQFCIAFCDIDNFKRINDSYGHDAGDEVLRHITGIIKKEMNGYDICRWGGEEIIILLNGCDIAQAREKSEVLRKDIEANPTVFFNKRIAATITIGLEENRSGYTEPEDLIKHADARMYYGKQHGKNIVISEDE